MTTTRIPAFLPAFLLSVFALTFFSGCEQRTPVPAGEMKYTIDRVSYAMIQSVNKGEYERARIVVAPEAEAQFEEMLAGLREGRYSQVLIATDEIDIDYRRGTAKVNVNYMKHQPGVRRETRNVGADQHLWRYKDGVWSWHGPVSKAGR